MPQVGQVAVQNHQPAYNAGNVGNNQAPQQQQGPVQFRSSNKNVFVRLAEKVGLKTPHTAHNAPHGGFTMATPVKRGLTTIFSGMSVGTHGARTEGPGRTDDYGNPLKTLAQHRADLVYEMSHVMVNGVAVNESARLDTNYTINTGNQNMRGFSISANANGAALDNTRPVVLYLSGSGGAAENYGAEIGRAYALDKNVNFVAVNYRGYGGSDQVKPSEASLVHDGIAMINHLIQNEGFSPDQIIVHGYSMGATIASHVQSRVEETGHELRSVIYDRPMTSATGAAHDMGKEMAKEIWDNRGFKAFAGAVGTAVAKVTVGDMSAHKTLKALQNATPGHTFRSPTHFTSDTGAFGDRSDRMATDLGGNAIHLNADHFTQSAFVNVAMPTFPNAMFA